MIGLFSVVEATMASVLGRAAKGRRQLRRYDRRQPPEHWAGEPAASQEDHR